MTLPFGTFERVLAHESNKGVASAVAKAQKELVSGLETASSLLPRTHAEISSCWQCNSFQERSSGTDRVTCSHSLE